jgi:hypothetical protein
MAAPGAAQQQQLSRYGQLHDHWLDLAHRTLQAVLTDAVTAELAGVAVGDLWVLTRMPTPILSPPVTSYSSQFSSDSSSSSTSSGGGRAVLT